MAKGNEVNGGSVERQPMTGEGPDLLALPRWETERALFEELCLRALAALRADLEREHSEPDLNRRLVRMFNRAVRQMHDAGINVCGQIVAEAKCFPNLRRPWFEARERTIPDFRYQYTDTKEIADFATKDVVAECKRLGRPEKDRVFNKLYVQQGINRFQNGYADQCPSAFMIGYVQDMNPDAILIEVNVELDRHRINRLRRAHPDWKAASISTLTHSFDRGQPAETFVLRHLWLDLRESSKIPPIKIKRSRRRSK